MTAVIPMKSVRRRWHPVGSRLSKRYCQRLRGCPRIAGSFGGSKSSNLEIAQLVLWSTAWKSLRFSVMMLPCVGSVDDRRVTMQTQDKATASRLAEAIAATRAWGLGTVLWGWWRVKYLD